MSKTRHPAFKKTDRVTGLSAIGLNQKRRPMDITVWDGTRHQLIGSLFNTHYRTGVLGPQTGEPTWKFMLYRTGGNVTLKYGNPDVEVAKQWFRDNIDVIWDKYIEPLKGKEEPAEAPEVDHPARPGNLKD